MDSSLPASSVGFSRQEYWSGLPFPVQEIFLTQGSNLRFLGLLHWQPSLFFFLFTTSTILDTSIEVEDKLCCREEANSDSMLELFL